MRATEGQSRSGTAGKHGERDKTWRLGLEQTIVAATYEKNCERDAESAKAGLGLSTFIQKERQNPRE